MIVSSLQIPGNNSVYFSAPPLSFDKMQQLNNMEKNMINTLTGKEHALTIFFIRARHQITAATSRSCNLSPLPNFAQSTF